MSLGVMVITPGWVAGEHIRAFAGNPHTRLAAIVYFLEEERQRAEEYCKKFGIDCRITADLAETLADPEINIATVCSINCFHYEHALAAIRAGKHTLVEKPVALDPVQVETLALEAQKAGVMTLAGHIVRYYPAVAALKTLVDRGDLGEIYHVEADYWHQLAPGWKTRAETAGSAMLMGGIHALDLVRHFIGEQRRPEYISAVWSGPFRRPDFDYKPNLSALVRYEGGVTARVGVSVEAEMPYTFHFQANGTRGTIRRNDLFATEASPGLKSWARQPGGYPDDWNVACHPFQAEIDDFVEAVRSGRPNQLDLRYAKDTYDLLFAIEESARRGAPVSMGHRKGDFCVPY